MLAVAVVAPRAFRRDPAFAQVFRDHGGVALGDVAVAARARRDQATRSPGQIVTLANLLGEVLPKASVKGCQSSLPAAR